MGIHKTSIKTLSLTVSTLNFTTSTFIISPPSLPKHFKQFFQLLVVSNSSFFVTLWFYTTFVHHYQEVYAFFYYNHFQSKLYQHRLFGAKYYLHYLQKYLLFDYHFNVGFDFGCLAVLMIILKIFYTNRKVMPTFAFFTTVT